jgi:Domain of unknown function (DUF4340)
MKLQRNPLLLMLSAALLAGGVYVYETRKPNPDQPIGANPSGANPSGSDAIFNFKEEEITFLTIATPQQVISVEKPADEKPADEKPPAKWQMSAPTKVTASEPIVAFLTNLLVSGKRDRVLTVGTDRKAEFGLDQPIATIDITLSNQQKHQLILGKLTFDRTALYAQVDPDRNAKDFAVSLISPQFANAVNRKLEEWQEKKPTASPTASPTTSPTASPRVAPSVLPTATASPSPTASPASSPTTSPTSSPTASPSPAATPTASPP